MKYLYWKGERRFRRSKSNREGHRNLSPEKMRTHCQPAAYEVAWSKAFERQFREQIKAGLKQVASSK